MDEYFEVEAAIAARICAFLLDGHCEAERTRNFLNSLGDRSRGHTLKMTDRQYHWWEAILGENFEILWRSGLVDSTGRPASAKILEFVGKRPPSSVLPSTSQTLAVGSGSEFFVQFEARPAENRIAVFLDLVTPWKDIDDCDKFCDKILQGFAGGEGIETGTLSTSISSSEAKKLAAYLLRIAGEMERTGGRA